MTTTVSIDGDQSCLISLRQALTEFVNGYFATNVHRAKTKAAYCSDLAQFLTFAGENLLLGSVGGSVIENWAAHLRGKQYSPASMRRKMVALRVFCSYWVRKGALAESPFWRVRLTFGRVEQLPRALTELEIKSLLTQARRNHSAIEADQRGLRSSGSEAKRESFYVYRAIRNLALVDLLFATGMRVGEASALDIRDFLVEDTVFRIQGKGGRDRLAFLVDEKTVRVQREHLRARKRLQTGSQALFLNSSYKRLSTQGITNVVADLRREAGIERHVTPHMLRHTVATLLLRNGVDIRVVQEFLGHASIVTTQRYTHVTKEHLIGVLRKSHPSLEL